MNQRNGFLTANGWSQSGRWVSLATLALAASCSTGRDRGQTEESLSNTSQAVSSSATLLVNQLGYPPGATKIGVIIDASTSSKQVEIISSGGTVVWGPASTTVKGNDTNNSGDAVHWIDFSTFATVGTGYKLRLTGTSTVSGAFAIDGNIYGTNQLGKAAMKYFEWKRSGIAISADATFGITAHGAGATGDSALTAYGSWRSGTFDVLGGWYDAGDLGKYMESTAAAIFFLGNLVERLHATADPAGNKLDTFSLNIVETSSTYPMPDILDLIAWGSRWVRGAMPNPTTHATAPARTDLVANKCASDSWPAYPTQYETDTTPRHCMGPSTSATYSAVRNMAMVSRLLRPQGTAKTHITMDGTTDLTATAYADKLWAGAKEAFGRATGKHPDYTDYTGAGASNLLASDINWSESPGFNVGSGPYEDDDMGDDQYAAAVELYLTACQRADTTAVNKYKPLVTSNAYYKQAGICDWGTERALGDANGEEIGCANMSLVAVHDLYCTGANALPAADLTAIKNAQKALADQFIANMNAQSYPSYSVNGGLVAWGSNGLQAGVIALLTQVYEYTGSQSYLSAAIRMMDYLLGVNPMRTSYVLGFGQYAVTATHDRVMNYSTQGKVRGTLVGGPLNINGNDANIAGDTDTLQSSQKDSVTPISGPALKRYANTSGDGSQSWESEENAINWEAAFANAAWGLQVYSDDMTGSGGSGGQGGTGGASSGGNKATGGSGGTGGRATGGSGTGGKATGGSGTGGKATGGNGTGGKATGGNGTGGKATGGNGTGGKATGGNGTGGKATGGGTGTSAPCSGLCSNPVVFTTANYQSGNLGTGAICRETSANLSSGNCSNMSSRTLTVNSTTMNCSGWALPAKRNGGYCVQVTAGSPDYASFVTW